MPTTNVGIIGCGAIGREIAGAIAGEQVEGAALVALYDATPAASVLAGQLGAGIAGTSDFTAFLGTPGLDLVVECASGAAVRQFAQPTLASGKDMLLLSAGALADADLLCTLLATAEQTGAHLSVPSGALGGIDALRAGAGLLHEVSLTTTKPPEGLRGAPGFAAWEDRVIEAPEVIFEGNVFEAVELFPANLNVAAMLSLAGLGPLKTKVRMVADPLSPGNVHEVSASGEFGKLYFRMENVPMPTNPRTSYLAVLSAIEALRGACKPRLRLGS